VDGYKYLATTLFGALSDSPHVTAVTEAQPRQMPLLQLVRNHVVGMHVDIGL